MIRPERWNEPCEIENDICELLKYADCSGPTAWYDNGEIYIIPANSTASPHIIIEGGTGQGKSEIILKPLVTNAALKKDSLIVFDPKSELLEACYWAFSDDYQLFVFDFRDPINSPTKMNLLLPMYILYTSSDPTDNDTANTMIHEFIDGLLSNDMTNERYWRDSTHDYLTGLLLLLFETAETIDEINLESLIRLMEQSEIRRGTTTTLKAVYDKLPSDSQAKRFLSTYVSCHAEETRGCIHSIAAAAINVFSRSCGLMSIVCDGSFNFLDIDLSKPVGIFFLSPDETDNDKRLVAIIITQIIQHLIRIAQKCGGCLPNRFKVIIDELGSMRNALPSLCNWAVAGRSRGIDLCLCLQDHSQLETLYSKSVAETIYSCIGTTFLFSSNNFQSLSQWAERVGDRQVETENGLVRQPLITPVQLAAMQRGTCLCMVGRRYKFITHLPLYKDMYVNAGSRTLAFKPETIKRKHSILNLTELATKLREQQNTSESTLPWLKGHNSKAKEKNKVEEKQSWSLDPRDVFPDGLHDDSMLSNDKTLDQIIDDLNRELLEIERQERTEEERQNSSSGVAVLVTCESEKITKIANIISRHSKMTVAEAKKKLKSDKCLTVRFSTGMKAQEFVSDVSEAGGCAWIDCR